MNFPRSFLIWAGLVICALTILGAMTWQTRRALDAEKDRIAAEARADLQEKMRLALWRMDSLGAGLIVEATRSGGMDGIRERFEWRENDPQSLPARVAAYLGETDFIRLFATVSGSAGAWKSTPAFSSNGLPSQVRASDLAQKTASSNELQKRSQVIDNTYRQNDGAQNFSPHGAKFVDREISPRPLWWKNELFLMQPASEIPRSIFVAWIDQSALRRKLLAEAVDLLPDAQLVPAFSPTDDGLVLASFPFRLIPGNAPVYSQRYSAPVTLSLVVGWSAALIAITAASLLVYGVMRLSERRASFVSAVTHELRTPLTTFRLYSEMLEAGIVGEDKRGEYLRILSGEADRLCHLVENVLSFSQVERGSARASQTEVCVQIFLESLSERFDARLATAGMELKIRVHEPLRIVIDRAVVEHILFNLVDNAAKYASRGNPPLLTIDALRYGKYLDLTVRDHGPGISPHEKGRIFRAFHKSAREAAESRPGVGLGLALSRRLAKSLGGSLDNLDCKDGACFRLRLPGLENS